jgi:hypothetical protein
MKNASASLILHSAASRGTHWALEDGGLDLLQIDLWPGVRNGRVHVTGDKRDVRDLVGIRADRLRELPSREDVVTVDVLV